MGDIHVMREDFLPPKQPPRRHLVHQEHLPRPDRLFEQLRHPLVQPDRHVLAGRLIGELVKRLVLQRPPQRVPLPLQVRRELVLRRDEHAPGIQVSPPRELDVILLAFEEVNVDRLGLGLELEVRHPPRVV